MSLTTISKGILLHINRYNISETKKKCILKLCEKQIPKAIQKNIYNCDICPVCEEKVKTDDKYCKHCGQHIIVETKDNHNLKTNLIDDKTIGNFKANSSIGQINIFIKWGFMKIYKEKITLMFNINDEKVFCERDNDILLVADKENQKGIIIYKPLEKVEIDAYERQDFTGWKQVRKFDPNIK